MLKCSLYTVYVPIIFSPLLYSFIFLNLFFSLFFMSIPPTFIVYIECKPHSGPGLGIGSPEADSEEGGGDQSS